MTWIFLSPAASRMTSNSSCSSACSASPPAVPPAAGAFSALPVQMAQLAEALRTKRAAAEGGTPDAQDAPGDEG